MKGGSSGREGLARPPQHLHVPQVTNGVETPRTRAFLVSKVILTHLMAIEQSEFALFASAAAMGAK
jgi:hypothetical protein